MKKDIEEPFRLASRLAAKQFGDAPRELLLTIDQAMAALKQNNIREAWLELNRAHRIVQEQNLDEWQAEVAAAWAGAGFLTEFANATESIYGEVTLNQLVGGSSPSRVTVYTQLLTYS